MPNPTSLAAERLFVEMPQHNTPFASRPTRRPDLHMTMFTSYATIWIIPIDTRILAQLIRPARAIYRGENNPHR